MSIYDDRTDYLPSERTNDQVKAEISRNKKFLKKIIREKKN